VDGVEKRQSASSPPLLVLRLSMLHMVPNTASLVSLKQSLAVLSVTASSTDPRVTLRRTRKLAAAALGPELALAQRMAMAEATVAWLLSQQLAWGPLALKRPLIILALAPEAKRGAVAEQAHTTHALHRQTDDVSAAEAAASSTRPAIAWPS
jgi:hypothetical protein